MPNRVIRDAVLDSDRYIGLTHDAERLLFLELLLMADDFGLVPLNFAFLRRRASPCAGRSEKQVNEMIEQLVERDLVRLYRSDSGSLFGYIPRFGNAPRAKKPKWPLPPDQKAFSEINELARSCVANAGKCSASAQRLQTNEPETETETETEDKEESVRRGEVQEGKATAPRKRVAETTTKRGSRLPDGWQLPKLLGDWAAQELGMQVEVIRVEAAKFADYWHSTPGQRGVKLDWPATWRNWCRTALERGAGAGNAAADPDAWRQDFDQVEHRAMQHGLASWLPEGQGGTESRDQYRRRALAALDGNDRARLAPHERPVESIDDLLRRRGGGAPKRVTA